MDTDLERLWSQVLEQLQQRLNSAPFETWIKTAHPLEWINDTLIICTPNPFAQNWLQKHYINVISEVVQDILGYNLKIQFTVANGSQSISMNQGIYRLENTPLDHKTKITDLNPKYIFSRFVVGANNRMAHAAALAVAESPGREFNPLFLCGEVGLGKTHLMQAISHYRLDIYPQTKVFYVSTEQFTNDLIAAIRKDSLQSFREHYRAADVLLVDDIQFIEDKEYTQEEFFYTFNTLHEAGKQIVLASDRPPKAISRLQERLSSRFSMGLIADIQPPDLETRMAILQKKAEDENYRLPRDVIEYIATNYTSNIRELEGALIRTVAYIAISGLPVTVANIAPILNPPTTKTEIDPDIIMNVVAETFNISVDDLKSNSRRREISWARQIAMYLMRNYTDLSFPRIGEEFGGKDHTTVLYSCEKIAQLQKNDSNVNKTLRQISDRIHLLSQRKN